MRRVLILGADGFIGRHIATYFRTRGDHVIASARRTSRLSQMGFDTLHCDLTSAQASDVGFWREHASDVDLIVNAAGVLTGDRGTFQAVHLSAPAALYDARREGCAIVLLSAVGIDESDTQFSRFRRAGEDMTRAAGGHVLRAGLVLADTSYGGSSLARALSALPFVTPVVGDGSQQFNPIHALDLARAIDELSTSADPASYEIGGPETVTQAQMLDAMRAWMGLPQARRLGLPLPAARLLGTVGDAMRLGPISRTAVDQLSAGVAARTTTPSGLTPPRGFSTFLAARPAGSQDLWHARLYLLRPVLRLTLAVLWFASAYIGLTLPANAFLPLLPDTVMSDGVLTTMARIGGIVDLAIGVALLRGWRPKLIGALQAAMVVGYTFTFTLLAPALWLLPLGGLLKNIPILALIAIAAILEDER